MQLAHSEVKHLQEQLRLQQLTISNQADELHKSLDFEQALSKQQHAQATIDKSTLMNENVKLKNELSQAASKPPLRTTLCAHRSGK